MNKTIPDPDRPLDDDAPSNGIIMPAVDLGLKAGFAGLTVGAFSSRYYWPQTFRHIPRIGALAASYAAMGASFGAVRGLSEELRKADTPINWFNGGIAAGVINGFRLGNTAYGLTSAVTFGVFMALLKGFNTSVAIGYETRYASAAEKDRRRATQWRDRKFEDTVKLDVFGDKAEEVKERIRQQVENREGPYSKLPLNQ